MSWVRLQPDRAGRASTRQQREDAARIKEVGATPPLGRAGRPEEVAESIMWLLSDKASLVTGAILNVMGAQR